MKLTQNDFLYILGDAIQTHEGWGTLEAGVWIPTRSVNNNNPGNIKFVGQAGVTPDADNFCVAPDFLTGKALQIHDLTLKLTKYNTIREIISVYAPPSENNTEAYITAVVNFFIARGIPVTDTMPLADILALPVEMILVVINGLSTMANWNAAMQSLNFCVKYMPGFGISTRYVNATITAADFYPNPSPIGNLYALNESFTRPLLAPWNEGQKLNALLYLFINNTNNAVAGGVEYGGEAISFQEPGTAFCNVLFEGNVGSFVEYNGRAMFHEFIHCLFTLTGFQDYLHTYLVAHGGYAANLLVDLNVVYADILNKYKTGAQVVAVGQEAVAIATADKNPADQFSIQAFLAAVVQAMKEWLNQ